MAARVTTFTVAAVLLGVGCTNLGSGPRTGDEEQTTLLPTSVPGDPASGDLPQTPGDPDRSDSAAGDAAIPAPASLTIDFLGVQGFLLRRGTDAILTAPFFSNPSFDQIIFGKGVANRSRIDQALTGVDLSHVRAILVGHAHYDHLMDVPYLWSRTADAFIYGNLSMRNLLSGFAADAPELCDTPIDPSIPILPRDRLIALNDPLDDRVDSRNCVGANTCEGSLPGRAGVWEYVPDSRVRIMALCASHPDQFLWFHFGEGCVERAQCQPPAGAADWLEGATLAYVIDFLDSEGSPEFRVFYQDAPTDGPIGHVPQDLLAAKSIDLAIICTGTYDRVRDHPGELLAHLQPRFVLAGHWEDFFRPQDEPLRPIPFMDLDEFKERMEAAMPPDADGPRWALPDPGMAFELEAQ